MKIEQYVSKFIRGRRARVACFVYQKLCLFLVTGSLHTKKEELQKRTHFMNA